MARRDRKRRTSNLSRNQVEGRNPMLEALDAGREFKRILIDRNVPQEGKILEIIKKARGRGFNIEFVARGNLDYISQTSGMHQGIIGNLAGQRETPTLKNLLDEYIDARRDVFLVILTDVQDERNLGAIIRTAVAAGASAVVVPTMSHGPITPVVSRTSAGAAEKIPVISESIFQVFKLLEDYGIRSYAVELGGKKTIYEADLRGTMALVIGGEDKGVSDKVQEKCFETLLIPMPGKMQSLNMSVSAALAMYEKVRQDKFAR